MNQLSATTLTLCSSLHDSPRSLSLSSPPFCVSEWPMYLSRSMRSIRVPQTVLDPFATSTSRPWVRTTACTRPTECQGVEASRPIECVGVFVSSAIPRNTIILLDPEERYIPRVPVQNASRDNDLPPRLWRVDNDTVRGTHVTDWRATLTFPCMGLGTFRPAVLSRAGMLVFAQTPGLCMCHEESSGEDHVRPERFMVPNAFVVETSDRKAGIWFPMGLGQNAEILIAWPRPPSQNPPFRMSEDRGHGDFLFSGRATWWIHACACAKAMMDPSITRFPAVEPSVYDIEDADSKTLERAWSFDPWLMTIWLYEKYVEPAFPMTPDERASLGHLTEPIEVLVHRLMHHVVALDSMPIVYTTPWCLVPNGFHYHPTIPAAHVAHSDAAVQHSVVLKNGVYVPVENQVGKRHSRSITRCLPSKEFEAV